MKTKGPQLLSNITMAHATLGERNPRILKEVFGAT